MAINPVYMPKYGMTMTEGYLVEWLVKDGDYVEEGKPIFTVETEKSNTDVEAAVSGYITDFRFQEGDDVPVGEIMAYIVDSLEEIGQSETPAPEPQVAVSPQKSEEPVSEPESSLAGQPLEGMRKKVAQSMMASISRTAQYTLMRDLVVDPLVELKGSLEDISYNDLLIKALALAVQKHPEIQHQLVDGRLHRLNEVNIGLAVSLEDGLIVPVIKNADRLTMAQIAKQRKELVQKARQNALSVDEMLNGSCTLSNLGNYYVDSFTPILNTPETVILGVGRITQRPVVENGNLVPRYTIHLSLTADHQILDGAKAAEFLQTFCLILNNLEELNV